MAEGEWIGLPMMIQWGESNVQKCVSESVSRCTRTREEKVVICTGKYLKLVHMLFWKRVIQ